MKIELRKSKRVDLPEIHRLLGYIPAMEKPTLERFSSAWAHDMLPEILVAAIDDKPVGVAIYNLGLTYMGERCVWMDCLAVDEKHRKRGIATRLIHGIQERVGKLGIDFIPFVVYKENTEARAFYASLGAKKVRDDFITMGIPVPCGGK
jgi:N-acetylglutamate synthase-like GNAT family acetyltransferase